MRMTTPFRWGWWEGTDRMGFKGLGRSFVLGMLLLLVTLAATSTTARAVTIQANAAQLDGEEKAFVALLNNYRAANGLPALSVSLALTNASAYMSQDLSLDLTPFDHIDSLGRTPQQRMAAYSYGYNTWVGENVAAGRPDAASTFQQFQNSAEHNANMLNARYTTMGVARVHRPESGFGWYWTTDFGGVQDQLVVDATTTTGPPSNAAGNVRSAFTALAPERLLDTRSSGAIAAGGTILTPVLGRAGVPTANVIAVVLTVTMTGSTNAGFVTVYPSGSTRPESSNLNVQGAQQTVANLVTTAVGPDGSVALYASGGGHLLVDVAGYFAASGTTANAGRFQPITPVRLLDTRANATLAPKGRTVLHVLGRNGAPARGAAAVSINVTLTNATRPGFVTAYPATGAMPTASNLNLNAAGDTVAAAAIVPLDSNGDLAFYVDGGGDLIVDINGWFTDGSAANSSSGLFVSRPSQRSLDTRSGAALGRRAAQDMKVANGAIAVSANLTLTGTSSAGFLSAWATGSEVPVVSSLNASGAGRTVANHAIVPAAGSSVRFMADMPTNLIVDVDGYYLPAGA